MIQERFNEAVSDKDAFAIAEQFQRAIEVLDWKLVRDMAERMMQEKAKEEPNFDANKEVADIWARFQANNKHEERTTQQWEEFEAEKQEINLKLYELLKMKVYKNLTQQNTLRVLNIQSTYRTMPFHQFFYYFQ